MTNTILIRDVEQVIRNRFNNSSKHPGEIWSKEYQNGYEQALFDLIADLQLDIEEE
jgi:hypothetical protein